MIWKFVRREDEFTEEGVEKRYSTLLSVRHYMHRSSTLVLSESLKARNLGPKGELLPPPPLDPPLLATLVCSKKTFFFFFVTFHSFVIDDFFYEEEKNSR